MVANHLHDAETRHDIKRTQRGIQADLPLNCRKTHRQVTPPEALSPGEEAEEAAKSDTKDPVWR